MLRRTDDRSTVSVSRDTVRELARLSAALERPTHELVAEAIASKLTAWRRKARRLDAARGTS